jgi:GNAT acetyltransferase-like protein
MGAETAVSVRELGPGDLQDALRLSTSAGWNQQIEDWRCLRDLAGAGAFAAVSGSRVLGTALALDYTAFAWIAMMLVDASFRGQGVGARLLEAAMNSIPPERTIRLDATPAGRPLYRKHGFLDETTLTRSVAPAARRAAVPVPGRDSVRPLLMADVPFVARTDSIVFGGDRRAVLTWALDRAPHYARMIEGAAPQYTLGRPGRLFDQIGPVVAADDVAATALVSAALESAAGRAVVIDAFDGSLAFTSWLRARGFADERALFRMRRAGRTAAPRDRPPSGAPFSEFAILGPDFA